MISFLSFWRCYVMSIIISVFDSGNARFFASFLNDGFSHFGYFENDGEKSFILSNLNSAAKYFTKEQSRLSIPGGKNALLFSKGTFLKVIQ